MMSQQKNLEGFRLQPQLHGSASHNWRTSGRILPLLSSVINLKIRLWVRIITGFTFTIGAQVYWFFEFFFLDTDTATPGFTGILLPLSVSVGSGEDIVLPVEVHDSILKSIS